MTSMMRFDSLPPAEQFEVWHDAVSNAFVPLEATNRTTEPFGGELLVRPVGAVQVSDVSGGPVEVERTLDAIRKGDPGYLKLGAQLRGYCLVRQDGREAPLLPGDFAIYDTRRPYQLSFDNDFRMLVVMFPRELLNVKATELRELTARRISGRSGVGGLISPFLANLAAELRTDKLAPTHELSSAILDLLTAAFAGELENTSAVTPETHRHALTLKIKSFIDERLDDPELSTATVAAAHHISPRYLQKLFEAEETTVTEWIRHRRLVRCSRDLADPKNRNASISRIAARWGLVDASHFARIFRSTYGVSPSEFRLEKTPR